MRMGGEGPKDEAGTQQRGGRLPRSQPGNKVTGPAWWAKLIEHYGEKQKNLAVNFAAEVDEITNPGHHKIVSDLLDKGEWQKAANAATTGAKALVAYYCQDTSTEVFKKVHGIRYAMFRLIAGFHHPTKQHCNHCQPNACCCSVEAATAHILRAGKSNPMIF